MIKCNIRSGIQYVVETSQTLRKRMNDHRQDIREENIYVPIAEHFNKPQHTHRHKSDSIKRTNIQPHR